MKDCPCLPFHRLKRTLIALVLIVSANLNADNISPDDTSLRLVPADAAVYSTSLQLDQQLAIVLNSNAYAKLKSHPMVQFGLAQVQGFWQAQSETYEQLMEDPDNQQLLELLRDAFAHEIFMYGDEKLATWLAAAGQISNEINKIQMETALNSGGDVDEDEMAIKLFTAVLDQIDLSNSPGGVVGFKTTMPDAAASQIKRLQQFAAAMIDNQDELEILKDRLSTTTVNGKDFLTLTLDGKIIPWDEVGDDMPAEIKQKLQTELNQAKFTISLGVLDEYVLLAIGPDSSAIEKLGQGENLLSRKELQPVRTAGAKQFVSIGYVSSNLMRQISSPRRVIEQYASLGKSALEKVEQIDADMKKSLIGDIDELKNDLLTFERELGAATTYSFLNDSGHEGYSYDWREQSSPAPTTPLTILDHVGGSPILFVAGRAYSDQRAERVGDKWLRRAFYYADRIIRQEMDKNENDESLKKYEAALAAFTPLANELAVVFEEKLTPAFANGQSAFVIDAEARNDQWHGALPPGDNLPMLEIASLSTVSNAPLARDGFGDMFRIAQTALEKAIELNDSGEIPFDSIPLPIEEPFADGTIYSYDLPPAAQLSNDVRPNALITNDVMILSLMPETTRRLATRTALDVQGVFVGSDKPFVSAIYFSSSKLLTRIREWVEFGAELSGADLSPYELFFDVVQCFEGFSSATYIEGDATVTHFESRFRDLD